MEGYRAIRYSNIGLPDDQVTYAATNTAPYGSDSAYTSTAANRVALSACGTSPCTTKTPVQTLTGADGKSYRLDTYITWQSVGAGRQVKLVTIVVRDAANPTGQSWARTASAFDESTGT
jgi:hypothetical protein